jgi:hypothetical protein
VVLVADRLRHAGRRRHCSAVIPVLAGPGPVTRCHRPAPDDAVRSGINRRTAFKHIDAPCIARTPTRGDLDMSTTTARLERRGLKVDEFIRHLNGFYCYNVSSFGPAGA